MSQKAKKVRPKMWSYVKLPCFLSYLSTTISLFDIYLFPQTFHVDLPGRWTCIESWSGDRLQLTGDRLQVTGDRWQVTDLYSRYFGIGATIQTIQTHWAIRFLKFSGFLFVIRLFFWLVQFLMTLRSMQKYHIGPGWILLSILLHQLPALFLNHHSHLATDGIRKTTVAI